MVTPARTMGAANTSGGVRKGAFRDVSVVNKGFMST